MIAFAALLERLSFTPRPSARLALVGRYLRTVPDPDRGFGLAALAGTLRLPPVRPAAIRALAAGRTDPQLFAWSHDYVGELIETVALTWPERPAAAPAPRLSEVVAALETARRADLSDLLAGWLDASEPAVRLALLKLVAGGVRVPGGRRLALAAVAALGGLDPTLVEEVWHGLGPPYVPLFAWASGQAPRPAPPAAPVFRPPMGAEPVPPAALGGIGPAAFRAEWKWDGVRVQLVATGAGRRVFSREGEDLSGAVPELVAAMAFDAVLDGELLALRSPPEPGGGLGAPAPVACLRRRLSRSAPSAALRRECPVGVRLFDILFEGGEDLRALPFDARRARLEAWFARVAPAGIDLSPLVPFADAADLTRLLAAEAPEGSAGLVLKRRDGAYGPGGPGGTWWRWKPPPKRIDAVLMYVENGAGEAAPDYTVGVWDGPALVPVGKARSELPAAEARWLEHWIGANTIARFGPVREVDKALVLEVAFDAAEASTRHKARVVLRGTRIVGVRREGEAAAAGRLGAVTELVG